MDYLLRSVVRVYFLFGALTHQEINSSKTQHHYSMKFWQLGVLWCSSCIKPVLVKQHFWYFFPFIFHLHWKGPPASFSLHCCKRSCTRYTLIWLISYFPSVKSTLQKNCEILEHSLFFHWIGDTHFCYGVLEVDRCICALCSHSLRRWTQHTSCKIKYIAGIHCQTLL